jgi:hypothetical protein
VSYIYKCVLSFNGICCCRYRHDPKYISIFVNLLNYLCHYIIIAIMLIFVCLTNVTLPKVNSVNIKMNFYWTFFMIDWFVISREIPISDFPEWIEEINIILHSGVEWPTSADFAGRKRPSNMKGPVGKAPPHYTANLPLAALLNPYDTTWYSESSQKK